MLSHKDILDLRYEDDPIGKPCRHHGNTAEKQALRVEMDCEIGFLDLRTHQGKCFSYNPPMIPLRIHRILAVLFVVSAFLALLDDVLLGLGIPKGISVLISGVIAGGVVFCLSYEGGRILMFCGKGLIEDPIRRAKISASLADIGVRDERRESLRRRSRPAKKGPETCLRVEDRRQQVDESAELMFVSVVESDRFIAITVNAGESHRAFISTRLVDSLTPDALRGVLAHEYGHVDNAHPLKQATILGIVAAVKMSIGVPLGAVAIILMAYLFMLREWEFIADASAVKRSCYQDVLAAFSEYRAISGEKDISRFSELFSGHPGVHRRIASIYKTVTA